MKCPYCGKQAKWVSNELIYGKRYGTSYMIWLCKPCDAYVGCHCNTKSPLGTLANAELRKWRTKAHKVIDPLWHGGGLSRKEVYQMLHDKFGREIHIGTSDIETCNQIIKLMKDEGGRDEEDNYDAITEIARQLYFLGVWT